jgi:hypothetical protein
MVLGDTVHVEATPPAPKMAFFDALYARLMQGN